MDAEALVNALIESDDADPKEFLSQQSCENLLARNDFKPLENTADTFYRYYKAQFGPGEATAILAVVTLHYSQFLERKEATDLHIKLLFVKQPEGWEAGMPVGKSFVWVGSGDGEMDTANKLGNALQVISSAANWDNQRRANSALRSGLAKIGYIANQ